MHWLLSLDHALFHFVNRTLTNPFFDWLMPILSGHGVPWLPAAVIGLIIGIVFGSTRLRVCGIFILLVIAIGDGFILNIIKDTVARARPCVALEDTVKRLGCGGYRSFPSAHAGNWFAMATVAFFFYRRSAWFMFPLAAGVAFSRVYCGVHFPIDVTAGAILGAGYAIAILFGTQMLWNSAGRKLFPAWHAQLPNLLNPDVGDQRAGARNQLSALRPPPLPASNGFTSDTSSSSWRSSPAGFISAAACSI